MREQNTTPTHDAQRGCSFCIEHGANQLTASCPFCGREADFNGMALADAQRGETPRVDAYIDDQEGSTLTTGEEAMCNFARTLERELTALQAENRELKKNRDEHFAVNQIHERHVLDGPKNGVDGCDCPSCHLHRHYLERLETLQAQLDESKTHIECLQVKYEGTQKAYSTVKDWAHRLEGKLETIIARCDEHADGTSDATDLEKFANEIIGLSNDISLGTVRTLRAQLDEARRALGELHSLVKGECPSLLNEDSGGDAELDLAIDAALNQPKT